VVTVSLTHCPELSLAASSRWLVLLCTNVRHATLLFCCKLFTLQCSNFTCYTTARLSDGEVENVVVRQTIESNRTAEAYHIPKCSTWVCGNLRCVTFSICHAQVLLLQFSCRCVEGWNKVEKNAATKVLQEIFKVSHVTLTTPLLRVICYSYAGTRHCLPVHKIWRL